MSKQDKLQEFRELVKDLTYEEKLEVLRLIALIKAERAAAAAGNR